MLCHGGPTGLDTFDHPGILDSSDVAVKHGPGDELPDYNQGGAVKVEAIPGSVTVEPSVLETIARLTTLEVPGVVDIVERDVDRILGVSGRSVVVQVKDDRVQVEVHVIAGPDQSLLQLGRRIQYEITRAVQQMIGMPVEAVNVHIEDVVYPGSSEWSDSESRPDVVI
jgi:uncharacterized alkaline shock family protein YloU